MSEAASKLAPQPREQLREQLRVAVCAEDVRRRSALSKAVAEAGHIVVGAEDIADVVLADGDGRPGETRPVVTLGGPDRDLPGVLSRHANASQIDAAIRAVAAGLIVRSPDAADTGFDAMREADAHALLTPRELDVLAALAEGMTNKAIARRLNISLHTVKFHVESVFRKLGARTRTEAVAKASERRRRETINL
jgi:DNA-binding CsgD family transcriptional regulator